MFVNGCTWSIIELLREDHTPSRTHIYYSMYLYTRTRPCAFVSTLSSHIIHAQSLIHSQSDVVCVALKRYYSIANNLYEHKIVYCSPKKPVGINFGMVFNARQTIHDAHNTTSPFIPSRSFHSLDFTRFVFRFSHRSLCYPRYFVPYNAMGSVCVCTVLAHAMRYSVYAVLHCVFCIE